MPHEYSFIQSFRIDSVCVLDKFLCHGDGDEVNAHIKKPKR